MGHPQDFDLAYPTALLNEMAAALAVSNAEAERDSYQRFTVELRRAIKQFGVWNALAALPDVLRSLSGDEEHWSEAELDYQFAAEVIEAALVAVDLKYGERSSESGRKTKLDAMLEMMKGIRT